MVAAIGVLYVITAARDIVLGDSPELTGAAVTLGVPHPPGYPLWTILAHLFTLLPVGPLPFRVSLFSVASSLVCLGIVYATAHRLTRSSWASAAAAVVLGLSPAYWAWSLVPEVFALNNALAAAMLYLLLRWHAESRPWQLVGAALTGGLGVANQQTIALVGIAVLGLMAWHGRRLSLGLLTNAATAFGLGLLPYIYLPLAAATQPPWNWSEIASVQDLVGHVLRVGYGSTRLVSEARFAGGATTDRLVELAQSFTPIAAVLLPLGAWSLWKRDQVWTAFLGAAFVIAGPIFMAYANIDISRFDASRSVLERFFLLPHVVVAPLVAVAMTGSAALIQSRFPDWRSRALTGTTAATIGLSIGVGALAYTDIDQSQNHVARYLGEDILATVRPNAILIATGDPIVMPVEYLMKVEGLRPDVTFLQVPLLRADWYVRQVRRLYPKLVLRSSIPPGTARDLVEPNGASRFDVVGDLPDDSLRQELGYYRRGLVEELRPVGEVIDREDVAKVNDDLLRSYRIPVVPNEGRRRWERLIRVDYAVAAYDVGSVYELAKEFTKAREWYERAVAIDPELVEARAGLSRIPR